MEQSEFLRKKARKTEGGLTTKEVHETVPAIKIDLTTTKDNISQQLLGQMELEKLKMIEDMRTEMRNMLSTE